MAAKPAAGPDFRLVILGTGTPLADPARSGPAIAIIVDGRAYIVDAGPGVVRRAGAAFLKGEPALEAKNLATAFITHLHSDHTVGLPDLILSPWTLDRAEPLALYGPPGLKRMADHIIEAYREDIDLRLNGLQPAQPQGWRADVHEIAEPGRIYDDGHVTVEAIPVQHGSWKYAYAYKFVAHGKSIVISGDTAKSEALEKAARGADILVHEVIMDARLTALPEDWRRYHQSFHTSSSEIAALAARAKPKTLVLYHQLYAGDVDTPGIDAKLVEELRAAGYQGAIISANDLDIFTP